MLKLWTLLFVRKKEGITHIKLSIRRSSSFKRLRLSKINENVQFHEQKSVPISSMQQARVKQKQM